MGKYLQKCFLKVEIILIKMAGKNANTFQGEKPLNWQYTHSHIYIYIV